jgi:hypothetical protein
VKIAGAPNSRLEMRPTRTRDMVRDYVQRHRELDIPAGTNAVVIREEPRRWQRRPRVLPPESDAGAAGP